MTYEIHVPWYYLKVNYSRYLGIIWLFSFIYFRYNEKLFPSNQTGNWIKNVRESVWCCNR